MSNLYSSNLSYKERIQYGMPLTEEEQLELLDDACKIEELDCHPTLSWENMYVSNDQSNDLLGWVCELDELLKSYRGKDRNRFDSLKEGLHRCLTELVQEQNRQYDAVQAIGDFLGVGK